eukprot:3088454-Rhodomonas_salina.5
MTQHMLLPGWLSVSTMLSESHGPQPGIHPPALALRCPMLTIGMLDPVVQDSTTCEQFCSRRVRLFRQPGSVSPLVRCLGHGCPMLTQTWRLAGVSADLKRGETAHRPDPWSSEDRWQVPVLLFRCARSVMSGPD